MGKPEDEDTPVVVSYPQFVARRHRRMRVMAELTSADSARPIAEETPSPLVEALSPEPDASSAESPHLAHRPDPGDRR